MDSTSAEMVKEIKDKVILHWNCRGLTELPEIIRDYGSHVQEIYLKWNKLTTLPPWIVELYNVTNLYIYGNLIKDLPSELGNMAQLTVLDLSANKLEQLTPFIGSLINLKVLSLNDNFIEKLPVEMDRLQNLEILSISGNRFVTLPEWIGSLPRLKELNADNNCLKELPNRLTLSPEILIISVCSNRLRYLPLNGFVSSPCIRFDANESLNYLSYPLLFQLTSRMQALIIRDSRNTLGFGCFKVHSEGGTSNTNLKLSVTINGQDERDRWMIELPRQLLKVHNARENKTVSLWELALRKVYGQICNHTLHISTAPLSTTVSYKPVKRKKLDSSVKLINYASYNLLTNGPVSICVNSHCQQPIFTEAWVSVGISHHLYSTTTIALCCSRSCACRFTRNSNIPMNLKWICIN